MNFEFMKIALEQAKKSQNDVSVGAVIVYDNKVIAKAHNKKEKNQNALLHAEMIVVQEASKMLGTWRLNDCELYVTLEPCPMCAAAIIQARISTVYFGAYDSLYGALGSKIDMRHLYNSTLEVKGGILEEECQNVLSQFFESIR